MKTPDSTTIFYAAAVALVAVALGVSSRTVAQTPRALAQIVRRNGDVLQLQGLAEKSAEDRAAFAAVSAITNPPPEPEAWLRERLPGTQVEVHERETAPLLTGWIVRRVDVLLPDIELATLGLLLEKAEGLRLPWRVIECKITALDGSGARGRVSLVWEGLFRAESQPES